MISAVFGEELFLMTGPAWKGVFGDEQEEEKKRRTMSNPSVAHRAAFLPLPYDTPNSSRTVANDWRSADMDSIDIT